MASGNSNYVHGEMEVSGHRKTFGGFMGVTTYGGVALVCILLFPILVFGVNMSWLPALITTVVVGIILGLALKLKGGWYAGLVGGAIFAAIISIILSVLF